MKQKLKLYSITLLGIVIIIVMGYNAVVMESVSKPILTNDKINCFEFEMPDTNISRAIFLNLKSAIAINNKSKEVIYCYNADKVRPIASISKLLTAMVVLDNYKPDTILIITKEDSRRSSRSLFRVGTKIKAKDLLHAALLQSDNRAARALARSVAGSYADFAKLMNKKAKNLGLEDTHMTEPTGLDEENKATAADCARLVNLAIDLYPEIARITSLKKYEFSPINKKRKIRLINTNKMVFSKYKVKAGKTGFIIKSDYCLTTVLKNKIGEEVTIVVLGAPGNKPRFREARRLADYAFRAIH